MLAMLAAAIMMVATNTNNYYCLVLRLAFRILIVFGCDFLRGCIFCSDLFWGVGGLSGKAHGFQASGLRRLHLGMQTFGGGKSIVRIRSKVA